MLLDARWSAALSLSIGQLIAWGVLYYAYAVLSRPLSLELGLSGTAVAGAFSVSLLVSALISRRVGALLDRLGARHSLIIGAIAAVAAFIGLSQVTGRASLLYVFLAMGVAQALSLYEPAFRGLVDWFPQEPDRSRAFVLVTSVAGLASTVFLPLTAALVTRFGWRVAALSLATFMGLVALPLSLGLPGAQRVAPTLNRARPVHESGPLSLVTAAFALQAFVATGVAIHLIWHLVELGLAMEAAAASAGLLGAGQVPGRLLRGWLGRPASALKRLPLLLAAQGLALLAVSLGSVHVALPSILAFGAINGALTLERPAVLLARLGDTGFGAANGRLGQALFFAKAVAPFGVEAFHAHVTYTQLFCGLSGVLVLASGVSVAASLTRMAGRPETAVLKIPDREVASDQVLRDRPHLIPAVGHTPESAVQQTDHGWFGPRR